MSRPLPTPPSRWRACREELRRLLRHPYITRQEPGAAGAEPAGGARQSGQPRAAPDKV